jgi:hypothetical protein
MSSTTALEAWDALKEMFELRGMIAKVLQRKHLYNMRMQDGEDLEEFIRKLRVEFETMQRIAADITKYDEEEWITILVTSLPDSWTNIVQSLPLEYEHDPSASTTKANMLKMVHSVQQRLLAENSRQKGGDWSSTSNQESGLYNRTFKGKLPSGRPNQGSSVQNKPDMQCFNCSKMGHAAANCRAEGGGAYKGPSGSNQGNKKNFKKNWRNKKLSYPKEKSNGAIDKHDEYGMMGNTDRPDPALKKKWFADSGTTTHVCNDIMILHNTYEDVSTIDSVTGSAQISLLGEVFFKVPPKKHNGAMTKPKILKLTKVAYVPDSPVNLLSIPYITQMIPDCSMNFNDQGLIAMKGADLMFYGPRLKDQGTGGLYEVTGEAEPLPNKGETCAHAHSLQTWHKILGHLNSNQIKMMAKEGLVDGLELSDEDTNFDCEACVKAKSHVIPVAKKSLTKYTIPGELVVSDVLGPTRTRSLQGNTYYVSFTDAATRYARIYFMSHKNEAFSKYKFFEALVKTQHDQPIKTIQFDNGTEYVNKEFKDYMTSKGTVYRVTAPYTPQQNGIAERLNRTLMEKARAMIYEAGKPKNLWQEAAAYAANLRNRSATKINDIVMTPYEAFFGKKPDVTELQIFGSPCHVLDQSGKRRKLDPKTKPAVFVGIAENEGRLYRYITPGGHKVLHSRKVWFPKHSKTAEHPQESEADDWVMVSSSEGENDAKTTSSTTTSQPVKPEQNNSKAAHTAPAKTTKTGGKQPASPPAPKPTKSTVQFQAIPFPVPPIPEDMQTPTKLAPMDVSPDAVQQSVVSKTGYRTRLQTKGTEPEQFRMKSDRGQGQVERIGLLMDKFNEMSLGVETTKYRDSNTY